MSIYFKENGKWKLVQEPYIKRDGKWTLPDEGYIKQKGTWKLFFKDFTFNVKSLASTNIRAEEITLKGSLDARGASNGISDLPSSAQIKFEYQEGTSIGSNPTTTTAKVPQSTSSLSKGDLVNGQVLKTYDNETDDDNIAEFELPLESGDNDGFTLEPDQNIAYRAVATIDGQRLFGQTVQTSTESYTITVTTLPLPTPGPKSIAVEGQIDKLTGFQQANTRFYYASNYDLKANTPITLSKVENNALRVDGPEISTAAPDDQPDNPTFRPLSNQSNVDSSNSIIVDNESDYQIVAAARPDDETLDPGSDTDDISFGPIRSFQTPPPDVNVNTDPKGDSTAAGPDVTLTGELNVAGVDGTKDADLFILYREKGNSDFQTATPSNSPASVTVNETVSFEVDLSLTEDKTYEFQAKATLKRPNKSSGDISDKGDIEEIETELLTTADLTVNGNDNTTTTTVSKALFSSEILGNGGVGGQNSGIATLEFSETNGAGSYEVTGSSTSGQFNGTNQNFDARWETTASDENFSVEYPISVPSGGSTTKEIVYDADEQNGKFSGDVTLNGGFETDANRTDNDSNSTTLELNLSTSEEWAVAVSKDSNDSPDNTTSLNNTEFDFGQINAGGGNKSETITLHEVGGNNSATFNVSISSNGNSGSFTLSAGGSTETDNGTISGVNISPGGSTDITVEYNNPGQNTSDETATITFEFPAGGGAKSNPNQGLNSTKTFSTDAFANVDAPQLQVSTSRDFREFTAGSGEEQTRRLQIENTGTADLNYDLSLEGGSSGQFNVNDTIGNISPGGVNAIGFTYSPGGGGDHTDVTIDLNTDGKKTTINASEISDDGNGDVTVDVEGHPILQLDNVTTDVIELNSGFALDELNQISKVYESDEFETSFSASFVDASENVTFTIDESSAGETIEIFSNGFSSGGGGGISSGPSLQQSSFQNAKNSIIYTFRVSQSDIGSTARQDSTSILVSEGLRKFGVTANSLTTEVTSTTAVATVEFTIEDGTVQEVIDGSNTVNYKLNASGAGKTTLGSNVNITGETTDTIDSTSDPEVVSSSGTNDTITIEDTIDLNYDDNGDPESVTILSVEVIVNEGYITSDRLNQSSDTISETNLGTQ